MKYIFIFCVIPMLFSQWGQIPFTPHEDDYLIDVSDTIDCPPIFSDSVYRHWKVQYCHADTVIIEEADVVIFRCQPKEIKWEVEYEGPCDSLKIESIHPPGYDSLRIRINNPNPGSIINLT